MAGVGASPAYNMKNPAVKRILQEIKEVQADTSGDFMAEALESDIFEWHFTIRGPPDTEFEGGVYHGRILLPAEYPFKPPAFMMLTPSGRFETGVKICLSISAHHPEHWQPSWSVRTALTALVAFMPSPGAGALGSLDYTKDERRKLAVKSRQEAPRWGSADRQRLIDDLHARMLAVPTTTTTTKASTSSAAEVTPQLPDVQPPVTSQDCATVQSPAAEDDASQQDTPTSPISTAQAASPSAVLQRSCTQSPTQAASSASTPATPQTPVQPALIQPSSPAPASKLHAHHPAPASTAPYTPTRHHQAPMTQTAALPPDTWGLTMLAVALGVLIAAILLRKALAAVGYQVHPLSGARMFTDDH